MKNITQVIVLLATLTSSAYAKDFNIKNTRVKDLEFSSMNGDIFGPAIPGTFGLEMRKSLTVPANVEGPDLVKGKTCSLSGTADSFDKDDRRTFDLGHHYGLSSFEYGQTGNFVQISFVNVYHRPKNIYIICNGSYADTMNLTVGQIEADLGNSVEFYKN